MFFTNSDKIALSAIVISILTFGFSWYSFYKTDKLSKTTFNKNYRPYLAASNFAYTDPKDGKYYPDMRVVICKVFNAPAYVTSKQLSFYLRTKNEDSLIFQHPEYKNELCYPFDNAQYTINTVNEKITNDFAKVSYPNILIRKLRIEYQWISDSSLNYFFESEWSYDLESHDWVIISQKAN